MTRNAAEGAQRPAMAEWLNLFDRAGAMGFEGEGLLPLYSAKAAEPRRMPPQSAGSLPGATGPSTVI